jgi:hypothetical protein
MSEVAELSATELATRLLPLLKEYAEKIGGLADRLLTVSQTLGYGPNRDRVVMEAARLLCLHDALDKPVRGVAQEASGLIEHAALEFNLRAELKLRLDEIEEHIRFAKVFAAGVIGLLKEFKLLDMTRKLIEDKAGRYKAPF